MTSHAALPAQKPVKKRKSGRFFATLLAGVFIFALGVNVGNGRISVRQIKPVSGNLPDDLDYATVEAVYDKLRADYDGKLDQSALMDGLKQGLAQATGDPFTEFFNAKDAKDFDNELNGSFTGIGAELGKNADGNIEIISPIAGFPAEKAGLKSKDVLAEIDGQTAAGITVSEAVKKIRGEEGTKVKLKIIRNKSEAVDLNLIFKCCDLVL